MQSHYTIKNIAKYIDHTFLKSNAVKNDIINLCKEAEKYGFHSVCISPVYVEYASDLLRNTGVKICTVVGFPSGSHRPEVKAFEAEKAIESGAEEIDMVIQVGSLIDGNNEAVLKDMVLVTEVCHERDVLIKIIIETAFLSKNEKIKAAHLVFQADADFIKTSTGFVGSGTTVSDIKLLKQTLKETCVKIKAAGGIRTYEMAVKMIEAGADRIGTSSGVAIVKQGKKI